MDYFFATLWLLSVIRDMVLGLSELSEMFKVIM
jgi:hypothetical protein